MTFASGKTGGVKSTSHLHVRRV